MCDQPKIQNNPTVDIDNNDHSTGASKKDQILERIYKRNKDRQTDVDVKLEQRNKENVQFEGVDYFSETFSGRVHEIKILIENINDSAHDKSTDLMHLFSGVTLEIQELQRYLTTSTIFLTDFKIKACQAILNELYNSCEDTRIKLLPKKKFGFSGRKVAPKSIINPNVNTDKLESSPEKLRSSNVFIWTLANRKNEYIRLCSDEVNGKDVTISNLSNCFVELQGHAGSVQISNASDCTFLCGPISRSFFADQCRNCTLVLACQQLRLHSSTACHIYVHVTCRAVIEDCKQICVSSYCYHYAGIENDFIKAGLDTAINNYTDVADFNWLSPDVHSPNWKLDTEGVVPNWSDLRNQFKENTKNAAI